MSTTKAQADGLVTLIKGVWNDGIVLVVAEPRIHVNSRNDSKDKRLKVGDITLLAHCTQSGAGDW